MSDKIQCIRCWRRLPLPEAFYECDACAGGSGAGWMKKSGGSRRQLKQLPRRFWKRLFASDEDELTCPRHPQTELSLFCKCKLPLSPLGVLADAEKSFGLGFAGPYGAGKTLLIAAMVEQFRGSSRGDHGVTLLGVDGTDGRFNILAERLLRERRRPDPTKPESRGRHPAPGDEEQPQNFCWRINVETAGNRTKTVGLQTLYDVAGETWRKPHHQRLELFDRYLSHVTALVFLVDGAPLAEDLGLEGADAWSQEPVLGDRGAKDREWLSNIVERLGPRRAKQIDLALVISKADLLWDHRLGRAFRPSEEEILGLDAAAGEPKANAEERRQALAEIMEASGRGDLLRMARGAFHRVAPFAASSLGFRPTLLEVDGDRLARDLQPVGVVDPLWWLLRQQVRRLRH